jgi:probable rRNA maturation factor
VTNAPEGVALHLNAPGGHALPRDLLRRALGLLLQEEGVREGELSVTFLPDGPMRVMNRDWLGHDQVTDVLAFSLHEPGEPLVGDVYVGVEQGERQALEHGVERDEELIRLALHGTLHVLGYDHPDSPEERIGADQYRRQEQVLRRVLSP